MSKYTNPCDYCICKTCAIACKNGGAKGCGDCDYCKTEEYSCRCTNCGEYYNPKKKV